MKIYIEIEGGVISNIKSTENLPDGAQIVIVDYDDVKEGDEKAIKRLTQMGGENNLIALY